MEDVLERRHMGFGVVRLIVECHAFAFGVDDVRAKRIVGPRARALCYANGPTKGLVIDRGVAVSDDEIDASREDESFWKRGDEGVEGCFSDRTGFQLIGDGQRGRIDQDDRLVGTRSPRGYATVLW